MNLWQMSFSASIMIVAVIMIRALAINKLPKKTFLILWGIVLCRLFIPFSFPSQFSVYSLFNTVYAKNEEMKTSLTNIIPTSTIVSALEFPAATTASAPSFSPLEIGWFVGFTLCSLYFTIAYFRCRREFKTSIPVEHNFTNSFLFKHKMVRPIQIRQLSTISTPLTYGIFRPVILMPKTTDWDDEQQLQFVFAHEYIHIRRFDAITKLLLTAALCIHWYNPLVWLMYILFNRDIELSCDETVVRTFGEQMKSSYAHTLISMEEKKSRFTPLCNSFSKNAIEERITAIMKIKKTSIAAIIIAAIVTTGVTITLATTAAERNTSLTALPAASFTNEDYDKLLALRMDGYEKLSVAEFRNREWKIIDNPDTLALLERMLQDTELQKIRYTNEMTSFLFNTLNPIIAENWEQQHFPYYAQSKNATLEYEITRTIVDKDQLTVGEHEQAIKGMVDGLQRFIDGESDAALQDKATMQIRIQQEITRLLKQFNSSSLLLKVEYNYREPDPTAKINLPEIKPANSMASKDDYNLLLSLQTDNWANMSVEAFAKQIWLAYNNDEERYSLAFERVGEDLLSESYPPLSNEELAFITITLAASNSENRAEQQKQFTGEISKPYLRCYAHKIKERNIGGNSLIEFAATADYELTYSIKKPDQLTLKERDRNLSGVINGIQAFFDRTMDDDLVNGRPELEGEIDRLTKQYSNSLIQIRVENLNYLVQDERNLEIFQKQ
ncbi:beta-lactamase regulating signal transducer with metallopeptidase domain [Fontibacillus solani]|uniref:Beta-lactamase regulating signal transducer with metallopeptidase domain n=1 Tax=Fontibacillus solani TaxID=1572857 RepID=A0A7W3SRI8_9BACL|nr:M56 family metallopeptidase [Fontibacillus solani]MBA9084728.1 beta-lactamase regulating signal transducer with metallopeptidase domain [Fontibacillus solani]